MSSKRTLKAFLASVLALVLCFSMLVSTTFAWFTDTAESGLNQIVAGNLDVEVYYGDPAAKNSIQNVKTLFDAVKLWEPGAVAFENITVANVGNLALKYQLAINFSNENTVAGTEYKLSDVLKVAVVDSAIADNTTREGLIASIPAADWQKLASFAENGSIVPAGVTIPTAPADSFDGSKTYGIVIYWEPTEEDNNWNVNNGKETSDKQPLSIDLGISVVATQLTAEEDSFDNQYDYAAPWVGIIPASLADTSLEIVPTSGTQTGTITINCADDLVYLNKLAKEWVSLYSNGLGTNVGSYYENAGGKGTNYYYHWAWDIELAVDLDMSNIPMDSVDISYWNNFEGNGHTISNVVLKDGQDGLFINGAKAVNNLTVKNITVNAPTAQTVGAVSGNGAMTNVHVINADVTGGKYVGGICGKGSSFVNCSIKDSTVTGLDKTVGGLVGYSIGDPGAAAVTGNTVENVTVTGAYNVGGLLGQSQNETVENNTVKQVTVKSTLDLPTGASSNEVRTAELAARSNFADTIIGTNTVENVTCVNVVNVTNTAELQAAINSGATEIALAASDDTYTADLYVVPANRNLTITGQGADTKINFKKQQVRLELFDSLTISNCTIERMVDKSWGHLVFGSSTVAGGVYTISDCTFNGVGTQGIYINQNVAATFNIENCTFNGDFGGEGAITIQNNGDVNNDVNITVNVTDCSFNNIPATSHEIYILYAYNGWTLNAEGVNAFWKTNP